MYYVHIVDRYSLYAAFFIQFLKIRIHGIRQVSPEVFDSCDLEADYIQQWTPNMRGGRVSIPLDHGAVYHFIDSVAGGCVAGRKLKVLNRNNRKR